MGAIGTAMVSYEHTQKGWLHVILLAAAALCVCLAFATAMPPPEVFVLAGVAAGILFAALCCATLTVRDEGECLAVRFGPIPLFRKRILYSQITAAERARSTFLDGWGIHWMAGRGWLYNLWGFDCVRIDLGAKVVRIGTDDVDGLLRLLAGRVEQRRDSTA